MIDLLEIRVTVLSGDCGLI